MPVGLVAAVSAPGPVASPERLESKNYFLISLLQGCRAVDSLLTDDPALCSLGDAKLARLRSASTTAERIAAMKFDDREIETVANRLAALYAHAPALQSLVSDHLLPSGCYGRFKATGCELLQKAWRQDARGINYAVEVYAGGMRPNYPAIDSIGFDVTGRKFNNVILPTCQQNICLEAARQNRFYSVPLISAKTMLDVNDRMQAVIEEPLGAGHNRSAYDRIDSIDWDRYPYTAILVLGSGPEEAGVAISPEGKLRSAYAAELYLKGYAPYIIVSGGSVHPYHTPYNEAVEMKKYLMTAYGLPESAIIIEPHARHTTTNLRNASRIMIRQGFDISRPAIVTSSAYHIDYVGKMADRCIKELGCVPYRLGERTGDREWIFYPLPEALNINPSEPLDP